MKPTSSGNNENSHCYNCYNRGSIIPSSDPVCYTCSIDHLPHFATESCESYKVDLNLTCTLDEQI